MVDALHSSSIMFLNLCRYDTNIAFLKYINLNNNLHLSCKNKTYKLSTRNF